MYPFLNSQETLEHFFRTADENTLPPIERLRYPLPPHKKVIVTKRSISVDSPPSLQGVTPNTKKKKKYTIRKVFSFTFLFVMVMKVRENEK